jgi:hypothetical protein
MYPPSPTTRATTTSKRERRFMQAHHLDNDYYDGSRMLPAWQVSSSSDALSAMLYPCARHLLASFSPDTNME